MNTQSGGGRHLEFHISQRTGSEHLCVSVAQLLKDISQKQRDSRQQKQVDLRRAYITARFTPATLPAFFTLGDQLDYGGFENRALDPGQEYMFFILAELNSTTGVQRPPPTPGSPPAGCPCR